MGLLLLRFMSLFHGVQFKAELRATRLAGPLSGLHRAIRNLLALRGPGGFPILAVSDQSGHNCYSYPTQKYSLSRFPMSFAEAMRLEAYGYTYLTALTWLITSQ
eukprot:scaffold254859_cov20-Prasinocladus_malaysianus.AAC.1